MLSVTDFDPKETISEFTPGSIWTYWMLIDRQMQSDFMSKLHRWISKLTARHLQTLHLLITMVKETVILYKKKSFEKWKKSRICHWSESNKNAALPPADTPSFDHHGKGNGNFVQKKSFEKWKKVVSLIDLKVMKTRNDCEISCDCVKRANGVLHVGLCKEIFARKHTATHPYQPTSVQPFIVTTMTLTYIHLIIAWGAHRPKAQRGNNRLWSP